ncbi:hypothetical protein MTR67_000094 [Solanum verrucosum]|uniref:S-adenosylmethionine-dependent methyltransferase n=1 Tax=Solanum verrucosum TaxID=315347 RepID=A0AAF0PRL5_SOLVR|nr:hypothetical protein MTR67_000094 [Solanum verrucosum]
MTTSFPMNAGDGVYSYSKNSHLQKEMIDGAKEMVRDATIRKLNIKIILSSSNTLRIAELGCSIGPNTFSAMQYIVEALKDKLFPSRSIHFVHSSSGINWLSKIPKELVDEKSPAWNKGLIHYVGASNVEVVNAYFAQFEKDMHGNIL